MHSQYFAKYSFDKELRPRQPLGNLQYMVLLKVQDLNPLARPSYNLYPRFQFPPHLQ